MAKNEAHFFGVVKSGKPFDVNFAMSGLAIQGEYLTLGCSFLPVQRSFQEFQCVFSFCFSSQRR